MSVSAGMIKQALDEWSRIRIGINFLELWTVLVRKRIAIPFATGLSGSIAPGATTNITSAVSAGKVVKISEIRGQCNVDHIVATVLYNDNRLMSYDTDFKNAIFLVPVNYVQIGYVSFIQVSSLAILTNKSLVDTAFYNYTFEGEYIDAKVWAYITKQYFDIVREELLPDTPGGVPIG